MVINLFGWSCNDFRLAFSVIPHWVALILCTLMLIAAPRRNTFSGKLALMALPLSFGYLFVSNILMSTLFQPCETDLKVLGVPHIYFRWLAAVNIASLNITLLGGVLWGKKDEEREKTKQTAKDEENLGRSCW